MDLSAKAHVSLLIREHYYGQNIFYAVQYKAFSGANNQTPRMDWASWMLAIHVCV